MKRKIPISALRDVAVLFPGDLHELGLFLGKVYAARDREANARNTGVTTGPSRPTLHGLAAHYARVTDIDLRRIEGLLVKAGFDLGALVEFDPVDSANANQNDAMPPDAVHPAEIKFPIRSLGARP